MLYISCADCLFEYESPRQSATATLVILGVQGSFPRVGIIHVRTVKRRTSLPCLVIATFLGIDERVLDWNGFLIGGQGHHGTETKVLEVMTLLQFHTWIFRT